MQSNGPQAKFIINYVLQTSYDSQAESNLMCSYHCLSEPLIESQQDAIRLQVEADSEFFRHPVA
jgi:hypothetical protein